MKAFSRWLFVLMALPCLGCEAERELDRKREERAEWGRKKKERVKYYKEQGMSHTEAVGRFQLEDSFEQVIKQNNAAAERDVLEGDDLKRILE
ncbi:MAG: hypothetical protein AAF492_11390 [Verrucomicrobiota bacterium]